MAGPARGTPMHRRPAQSHIDGRECTLRHLSLLFPNTLAREMSPRPPSPAAEVEGRMTMTKSATKSAMSLIVFGTMLTLLAGTPAQATNTKSYVSNTGSDANDCSSVALACASL